VDCRDSLSFLIAGYVLAVINSYQRINYLGSDYLGTYVCVAAPISDRGQSRIFLKIFYSKKAHYVPE
jgi:hypothetical protein